MPQNFTRELIISPISATESETPPFNNAIKVISKVMWVD
jgi:hypothetical protein